MAALTPYANHILRDGNHSQRLQDVPYLRRLMVELSFMLTTVDTPEDIQAIGNLPSLFRFQERIIENIMRVVQTDRSHTVLPQASLRFVAARHEGDEAILAATNELVTLASAPVLTHGAEHEMEYQAASRLLDQRGVNVTLSVAELFTLAPGIHQSLSTSVHERRQGPPAPDAATMPSDAEQPCTAPNRGNQSQRTRPLAPGPPNAPATRDGDASPQHNSDEGSEGGLGPNMDYQDEPQYESDVDDNDPRSRDRHLAKARRDKRPASREDNRPAPKKARTTSTAEGKKPTESGGGNSDDKLSHNDLDPSNGEDHSETETNPDSLDRDEFLVYDPDAPSDCDGEVIDDFTYSRETPEVGKPNESLKEFVYNTEMPHPMNPHYRVLGEPVGLRYISPHNWADPRHKKSFRGWRNEKLNLHMGKRVAKDIFLKSEADELTKLVKVALNKVGGRWSKIDWETMKKDLDAACKTDKKQQAGEPIEPLRFSFDLKGGAGSRRNVLSCGRLPKDRHYPKRVDQQRNENNPIDLEEVFRSFIDPKKKRIWRTAQKADKLASGSTRPTGMLPPPRRHSRYGEEEEEDDEPEETPHGNGLSPRSNSHERSSQKPRRGARDTGPRDDPPRGFRHQEPSPSRYGYGNPLHYTYPTGNNLRSGFPGGRGRSPPALPPLRRNGDHSSGPQDPAPRAPHRGPAPRQPQRYEDGGSMSPQGFYGEQHDPRPHREEYIPRPHREEYIPSASHQSPPPSRRAPTSQGGGGQGEYWDHPMAQQLLEETLERSQMLERRMQMVELQNEDLRQQLDAARLSQPAKERRRSGDHKKHDQDEKHEKRQ